MRIIWSLVITSVLAYCGCAEAAATEPDLVRWAGQASDAKATPAPKGRLLLPAEDFWGEVIFSGAEITFAKAGQPPESLPGNGNLLRPGAHPDSAWVGGADGGIFTVTFPSMYPNIYPYSLTELTLYARGKGPIKLEYLPVEDNQWHEVPSHESTVEVPVEAKGEYWTRFMLPQPIPASQWRVTIPPGVIV